MRADSAGCSKFLWECRKRSIGFSVVARRTADVQSAVFKASEMPELWEPAAPGQNSADGKDGGRAAAEVADLTGLADTAVRWF